MMFKVSLLIALTAVAQIAHAIQIIDGTENLAPEPYAYGYETDTHAAAEERDPSGRVSGYYTLADADGRQRRVEYIADESGFHAKLQTNEHGTASASPADVQVLASPANSEQLIYQQQQQIVQQAPIVQSLPVQQSTIVQSLPVQQSSIVHSVPIQQQIAIQKPRQQILWNQVQQPAIRYVQQPATNLGLLQSNLGITGSSVGLYNGWNSNANYNYHVPSSYYAARTAGQQVIRPNLGSWNLGNWNSRTAAIPSGLNWGTNSISGLGIPNGYSIRSIPSSVNWNSQLSQAPIVSTVQEPLSLSSSIKGSSNYIVLKKKRDSEHAAEEKN